MKTFQSTYSKTIDDKNKPSAVVNSKLQQLYGNTSQINSNIYPPKQHAPSKKWVLTEERPEKLVRDFKNQNIDIEATLPVFEESLRYG